MIFPGFGVGASTDLIRKMGGGGLLGSGRIARCLLTPSTPVLVYTAAVSRSPSILRSIQRAAQQALRIF